MPAFLSIREIPFFDGSSCALEEAQWKIAAGRAFRPFSEGSVWLLVLGRRFFLALRRRNLLLVIYREQQVIAESVLATNATPPPVGIHFNACGQPHFQRSLTKTHRGIFNVHVFGSQFNLRHRRHHIGFQSHDLIIIRCNPTAPLQCHRISLPLRTVTIAADCIWLIWPLAEVYLPGQAAVPARQSLTRLLIIARIIRMENNHQCRQAAGGYRLRKSFRRGSMFAVLLHAQGAASCFFHGNDIVELSLFRTRWHPPLIERLIGDQLGRGESVDVFDQLLQVLPGILHYFVERARSTGFHRRDFLIHIRRQPARRNRKRLRRCWHSREIYFICRDRRTVRRNQRLWILEAGQLLLRRSVVRMVLSVGLQDSDRPVFFSTFGQTLRQQS